MPTQSSIHSVWIDLQPWGWDYARVGFVKNCSFGVALGSLDETCFCFSCNIQWWRKLKSFQSYSWRPKKGFASLKVACCRWELCVGYHWRSNPRLFCDRARRFLYRKLFLCSFAHVYWVNLRWESPLQTPRLSITQKTSARLAETVFLPLHSTESLRRNLCVYLFCGFFWLFFFILFYFILVFWKIVEC